jgi:anti-sigma B factor antagonist
MARLTITTDRPRSGVVCVALSGELDLSSAYRFDAELRRIEQTGPDMLIVDPRDLVFMDSAGLSRLLAAHQRARRGGWRFGLIRGSDAVQRMLWMTATHERFLTLPEPAAASR